MKIDQIRTSTPTEGEVMLIVTWWDDDGKRHVDTAQGSAGYVRAVLDHLIQNGSWPDHVDRSRIAIAHQSA